MSERKNLMARCGFNKWGIGVNLEDCCVVVQFDHFPNMGSISLFDIVGNDLEKIIEVFEKAKEYYDLHRKMNEITKKEE